MVDYGRAIKRPFSDFKSLMIGILLYIPVPFLSIITNTMAMGYVYNCGKSASEGDYKLPEWEKYWTLWLNAFVAGIIALIYMIPVIVILLVFAKDFLFGYATNPSLLTETLSTNPAEIITLYGNGVFAFFAAAVLAAYVLPVAILNWIKTGSYKSALQFKEIFAKAFTVKYFLASVVIGLVGVSLGLFTSTFFVISGTESLGLLIAKASLFGVIGAIIGFIRNVFAYTVYGNVLEEL